MAEAIGLASGILTLVIFTYDTSKSVYDIVSSFQSQREVIQDVQADLSSLLAVLTSIRDQAQRPSGLERLEPLRQPLSSCATSCKEMHEMLDACTTHSTDGRNSVRDWLKMQYHEKSFEDMKVRLASYKSTLSIAFNSINIQDQSVTQEALSALNALIAGTKEDLEDQLDQVRDTIKSADASAREVLQGDIDRLQGSLDSIVRAQGIADGTRPEVTIQHNQAKQGARAIFGTDTSQPEFNLKVLDNEAGIGAVTSAGVYSPETLRALLEGSRTPDLAVVFQALQIQSKDTEDQSLRSVLNTLPSGRQHVLPSATPATNIAGRITSEEANEPAITRGV